MNYLHQSKIRRQPLHTIKLIFREPPCFLSFQQDQISFYDLAPEAVHRQVKLGIIIFYRVDKLAHFYFCIEFFLNLSYQGLLRSFTGFDFSAGEFPLTFKFAKGIVIFLYPADHAVDKLDMFFHFHFFQVIDRLFAAKCKERNIAEAFIIFKLAVFLYCGVVLFYAQIFFI